MIAVKKKKKLVKWCEYLASVGFGYVVHRGTPPVLFSASALIVALWTEF